MQPSTNLLLRNDTILGVCEAIGQDFGFHPNWLRLAFACVFYFNPVAVIGVYLGLGLLVAATRWVAPNEVVPAVAGQPANQQFELLEAGLDVPEDEVQLAA